MTQPARYYLFADYNKMAFVLTSNGVDTKAAASQQARSWLARQAAMRLRRSGRLKGVMPKVLMYKLVRVCHANGEDNYR